MALPRGDDIPLHVYLSVLIPETQQYVSVDPTWDAAIRHPVIRASSWDGIHPTDIAVKSIKVFTNKEKDAFYKSITPEMAKSYMEKNSEFLYAFSDYLESLRSPL